MNFISQPIYMWAIPAVKMSVGFFLLRIAPNKFFRRLLQATMTFLMAYTFVCFLTLLLQCDNLENDQEHSPGHLRSKRILPSCLRTGQIPVLHLAADEQKAYVRCDSG